MTKGDLILVSAAVALALLVWAGFTYLPAKPQQLVAVITVDGAEVARLAVDTESLEQITITVPRGEAIIEYGQGKVRVLPLPHTVCPNEICWRMGWISEPGQTIVCVPNKMIVTLEGDTRNIDTIIR